MITTATLSDLIDDVNEQRREASRYGEAKKARHLELAVAHLEDAQHRLEAAASA